jgi:hypothetical protein
MSVTVADPNRLFMINTDAGSYKKSYPKDKHGSPFLSHWLPDGYAYVTPNADDQKQYKKYDSALAKLVVGDLVFAFENDVGIVAVGEVLEPADLHEYGGGTLLYPKITEIIKRVKVNWDCSVTLPTHHITAAGSSTRGGSAPLWRVKTDKLLRLLQGLLGSAAYARREAQENAALELILTDTSLTEKDRQALTKARVGQGVFRMRVMQIEQRCRVTGVANPSYLRASHIKPWCRCTGSEHLDGDNGLMLAHHVDYLFDSGLISFTDEGQMLSSRSLDRNVLKAWSIPQSLNVGLFSPAQSAFLAFHRSYVFEQQCIREIPVVKN